MDACDLGSVLVVRRHGSCLFKGTNLGSISVNYSEVRGGVAATLDTFFHSASTVGGSLSICLRNIAIFQISSSCSVVVKLGIAVKRMPCLTFQNDEYRSSIGWFFDPVSWSEICICRQCRLLIGGRFGQSDAGNNQRHRQKLRRRALPILSGRSSATFVLRPGSKLSS